MYRVLLADDEPWVLYGLKKLVDWEAYGFTVAYEAGDGISALKILREEPVDVAFTDIRMPGIDGMQLIEILNREENPAKIILISGYSEFEYAKKAVTYGVFDYLLKQIKKEDVEAALVRLKSVMDETRQYQEQKILVEQITEGVEDKEGYLRYLQGRFSYEKKDKEELNDYVNMVLKTLETEYADNLQLADFAEDFNISVSHLSNMIRKETGSTFTEHLARRRIQKAQELLLDERISVAAAAEMVGYGDYYYFTKIFKKYVGISPSKYRKNKKQN